MYIQNGELASAFHYAEKEYISETEEELLEEYRFRLNCGTSPKEAKNSAKDAATKAYKEFVRDFVKQYKEQYKEENGHSYGTDHPNNVNVFDEYQRKELAKEYREYLDELFAE